MYRFTSQFIKKQKAPSGITGFTIVKFLSFGLRTSPIQHLFLYALFQFIVGQSMTILSNTLIQANLAQILFFVWPQIIALCGYFGNSLKESIDSFFEFEIDLGILYYKTVNI